VLLYTAASRNVFVNVSGESPNKLRAQRGPGLLIVLVMHVKDVLFMTATRVQRTP
jgi:hypothetical protein